MSEPVIFKVLPADRGWKLVRDDKFVSNYATQKIAEKAAARHARAEANKGGQAKIMIFKKDGGVAGERSYTRLTTPWLASPKRF